MSRSRRSAIASSAVAAWSRSAGASSGTRRGRSSGRSCRAWSSRSCSGVGYLAYDVALRRGAALPGGDLRTLYLVLDVVDRPRRRQRRHLAGRPPAARVRDARRRARRGARRSASSRPCPSATSSSSSSSRSWSRCSADPAPLCAGGTTSAFMHVVMGMAHPYHSAVLSGRYHRSVGYPASNARTHSWQWTSSTSRCRSCTALPPTPGPRIVVEVDRASVRPDDLPIEAVQTDEEREIAASLPAHAYAPGGDPPPRPSATGRRRAAAESAAAEPACAGRPDPRPGRQLGPSRLDASAACRPRRSATVADVDPHAPDRSRIARGGVAQWSERWAYIPLVPGSSPGSPTNRPR